MNKTILLATVLSASMLFAGCSDNKTKTNSTSSSVVSPFPETIVLKEKPEGAILLQDVLGKIEKGKEITVTGVIGGKNCFDTELALFSLTQKATPETGCTAAVTGKCKKNAPATLVQYKDKGDKVVKSTFEGFKGLRKNAEVIVVGNIDNISTDKSLVINLRGFYIQPENSDSTP